MERRLPVLLQLKEKVYESVELTKPSGKILADTAESLKQNNDYNSMRKFVSGCIESFKSSDGEIITDAVSIKRFLDLSSTKNIEYLSKEIMIDYYDGEDYIEGVYPCPRCHTKVYAEKKDYDGIEIDTRDRASDLQVNFMDTVEELTLAVDFTSSIEIQTKNNNETIENIVMTFPTLEQTIQAITEVGQENSIKLQFAIWAKAIKCVNGQEVDNSWRRVFGRLLFEKITDRKNLKLISEYMNSYGVNPKIEKSCPECGKVWQPTINTFNFFDFALL